MMSFLSHDHAVLRGLLVGAVVLASASACSRPDRAETGNNNTGAIVADTANTQDQRNAVMPPAGDTASAANADTNRVTETANTPRAATATPSPESGSSQDTTAAGYREMERDTSTAETAAPRDTARVTTDSAVAPGEQSSVTPSDSAPMEVATGAAAAAAVGTTGVAVEEDAAANEAQVETAEADVYDSTTATSEQTDTAAAQTDTAAAGQVEDDQKDSPRAGVVVGAAAVGAGAASRVGDSDDAARTGDAERTGDADRTGDAGRTGDRLDPVEASAEVNDTLTQSEGAPVRPPEDSTEVYGNVNRETVAAAATQTDSAATEVGAAAIGGNVNGADAVALMTRQGVQCIVVDPESAQGVAADMSETPATVNPCGLGSMVLTRIWTKQQ